MLDDGVCIVFHTAKLGFERATYYAKDFLVAQ
jgi:hypothetical protein